MRAVKIIAKKTAEKHGAAARDLQFDSLRTEIEYLQAVQKAKKWSEHLIKYYDYFEDKESLYIVRWRVICILFNVCFVVLIVYELLDLLQVMEICSGGELFDYILEKKIKNEKQAQEILIQICRAINSIHTLDIAHCDIKPGANTF